MLPNLLIIGAQKCGTTSLHAYLDMHPDVHMAADKELDFFLPDRTWPLGAEWYAQQFDGSAAVRGESSPNYTAWPLWEGVPGRAAEVVPDARLVYLVRDPIARIESHYLQSRAQRGERRTIAEALGDLDDPRNTYVCRTRYATQLEQWLAVYESAQTLVIAQEDLRDHRDETVTEVLRFLGLDHEVDHATLAAEHHRSEDKEELTASGARLQGSLIGRARHLVPARARAPVTRRLRAALSQPVERQALPADLRERLLELLRPEMERLRELTGKPFAGWSA